MDTSEKILRFKDLPHLRERLGGQRIVQCHGVFDVLHAGHLAYFQSAKKFGDRLIVTLTCDKFVNKGPGRPFFNETVRAQMLAALELVDFVSISEFPTAVQTIEAIRPHIYAKGPDYKVTEKDLTGGIIAEEQAVRGVGGEIAFTDDATHSSSELINRFFAQWTIDQNNAIADVKAAGGFAVINEMLERISRLKITIAGEAIVDTYVFCRPENLSSKSPSVSARLAYEEDYAGGALAIANSAADFVKEVTLLTTVGEEPFASDLLKKRMDSRVKMIAQKLAQVPTPRKTRYISVDTAQRMFELTNLRSNQWQQHSSEQFCAALKQGATDDCLIVADFGHGLFEGAVLDTLAQSKGFIGLNVQTNSSNYGFNPFTKHKRFSFLSIDTREARVAYHDRQTPDVELARQIRNDLRKSGAAVAMTMGSNGAVFFPNTAEVEYVLPAFTDKVIDATGAGDAFFVMASLLVKVGCPEVLVPFVSNVYAGLKTKIVGHQSTVTKAQLVKACDSILK